MLITSHQQKEPITKLLQYWRRRVGYLLLKCTNQSAACRLHHNHNRLSPLSRKKLKHTIVFFKKGQRVHIWGSGIHAVIFMNTVTSSAYGRIRKNCFWVGKCVWTPGKVGTTTRKLGKDFGARLADLYGVMCVNNMAAKLLTFCSNIIFNLVRSDLDKLEKVLWCRTHRKNEFLS